MFHFENSYYIPNTCVHAWACKTNLPSNTAFRGFGGPQGMFAGEHIIRDVARVLRKDAIEIGSSRFGQLEKLNFTFFIFVSPQPRRTCTNPTKSRTTIKNWKMSRCRGERSSHWLIFGGRLTRLFYFSNFQMLVRVQGNGRFEQSSGGHRRIQQ